MGLSGGTGLNAPASEEIPDDPKLDTVDMVTPIMLELHDTARTPPNQRKKFGTL
jgi:hypothetical protein